MRREGGKINKLRVRIDKNGWKVIGIKLEFPVHISLMIKCNVKLLNTFCEDLSGFNWLSIWQISQVTLIYILWKEIRINNLIFHQTSRIKLIDRLHCLWTLINQFFPNLWVVNCKQYYSNLASLKEFDATLSLPKLLFTNLWLFSSLSRYSFSNFYLTYSLN